MKFEPFRSSSPVEGGTSSTRRFFPFCLGSADEDIVPKENFKKRAREEKNNILRLAFTA